MTSDSDSTSSDSNYDNNSLKNSEVDAKNAEMARPKYNKSHLRRTIENVIHKQRNVIH